MKTASQILEAKGYDNAEQNDIISANNNSLDVQTRDYFDMLNHPVHLWEAYYLGEADEDELNKLAEEKGFEDYKELLAAMDSYMNDLADQYPLKINEDFKKAIRIAAIENDLSGNFTINNNYSIVEDGKEKYQTISEDEIDSVSKDRKDYDGTNCVSFLFQDKEYFFVKQ